MSRSRRGENHLVENATAREEMRKRLSKLAVETESGCIVWVGSVAGKGYGVISSKNGQIYTHRAAWIVHFGSIPRGLCVLHRCDNPPCINPEHLWIGTHSDNTLDAARKGRFHGNRTWGEAKPITKLSVAQVLDIRKRYDSGERIFRIRARYPFVTFENIKAVATRRTWKRLPESA